MSSGRGLSLPELRELIDEGPIRDLESIVGVGVRTQSVAREHDEVRTAIQRVRHAPGVTPSFHRPDGVDDRRQGHGQLGRQRGR